MACALPFPRERLSRYGGSRRTPGRAARRGAAAQVLGLPRTSVSHVLPFWDPLRRNRNHFIMGHKNDARHLVGSSHLCEHGQSPSPESLVSTLAQHSSCRAGPKQGVFRLLARGLNNAEIAGDRQWPSRR